MIRDRLKATGKNQNELARATGIDAIKLSKSLNDTRRFQPQELENIEHRLNIQNDKVAAGAPVRPPLRLVGMSDAGAAKYPGLPVFGSAEMGPVRAWKSM